MSSNSAARKRQAQPVKTTQAAPQRGPTAHLHHSRPIWGQAKVDLTKPPQGRPPKGQFTGNFIMFFF